MVCELITSLRYTFSEKIDSRNMIYLVIKSKIGNTRAKEMVQSVKGLSCKHEGLRLIVVVDNLEMQQQAGFWACCPLNLFCLPSCSSMRDPIITNKSSTFPEEEWHLRCPLAFIPCANILIVKCLTKTYTPEKK